MVLPLPVNRPPAIPVGLWSPPNGILISLPSLNDFDDFNPNVALPLCKRLEELSCDAVSDFSAVFEAVSGFSVVALLRASFASEIFTNKK